MPRPIFFAFLVVTLDAMGAGLIFPVLPELLSQVFTAQTGDSIARDSTLVTLSGGILSFSFALMMFAFGPVLGSLSDHFGRQRVIFIAMLVMAFDYVLMAVTPFFWVLLVGRILTGIAGGSYTSAFAIAADVGDARSRPRYFGLISSGLGLGFILGPIIGGLVGEMNPRLPFWIAAGLTGLAAVLSLTFYQETLPAGARRTFTWAESNPLSVVARIRANVPLRAFLVVIFVFSVGETIYETIWHFYGTKAFGWSPWDISVSLVVFGAGMAAVQGGLAGPIINRFGALTVTLWAMGLSCLSLFSLTLVTQTWQVYALMPLMWVSGLSMPGMQSYLSNRTQPSRQGELQGILASIGSAALILAPLYGTTALAWATAPGAPWFWPGAPFAVALVFCLTAWELLRRAVQKL